LTVQKPNPMFVCLSRDGGMQNPMHAGCQFKGEAKEDVPISYCFPASLLQLFKTKIQVLGLCTYRKISFHYALPTCDEKILTAIKG
jgi:hypothetical protein